MINTNADVKRSSWPAFVLVRGFGGEPKKLIAAQVRGRLVEVSSLDKTAKICVPAVDVFDFDADLFDRLCQVHHKGNEAAIRETWKLAKTFT